MHQTDKEVSKQVSKQTWINKTLPFQKKMAKFTLLGLI